VRQILFISVLLWVLAAPARADDEELEFRRDGIGPIVVYANVELQGKLVRLTASARNESGVPIRHAEWCVQALTQLKGCTFRFATTKTMAPGETVEWKTRFKNVGRGLPYHRVSLKEMVPAAAPDPAHLESFK